VKASDAELKNFNFQKSAVSAPNYKIGGHSTTGGTSVGTIEIFTPKDGDTWEAGKEYGISWKSAGLSGDVKIVLERITIHAGGTSSSEEYPIVDRTANTGSYRFRVPMNWVQDPHGYHVRVNTLDGKMSGKSRGAIILPALPPPVDLECQIVDAQVKSQTKEYVFYADKERYLEFNVLFRNKGSRSPITINTVLVRIIKEPEDVVCMQEEWGLGGIYHNDWYKLPEPRKFNIQSWKEYVGGHVNLWEGAYRIEVELDPQNQVGEYEELRGDNKAVKKWVIKLKKGKGW
jgi:hypothetical protein